MTHAPFRHIGASASNRAAARLLTGCGQYADDARLTDPLFVAFHRSPLAHGQIASIDTQDAQSMPGVAGVHVGEDVAHLGQLSVNPILPICAKLGYPVLAYAQVDAVGQPIAAAVAETPLQAMDAAETIWADIEDGPPPPPTLVAEKKWLAGNTAKAFATADLIVDCTLDHARLAPSPMEPRSIAIEYTAGDVTIWHSTQTPHRTRSELGVILNVDPARIRVISTDVGGAFGMKASLYPEEVFAVWAAFHHKRSVKWTATRSEEFLSATHGRGVHSSGRLALRQDGTFLAIEAQVEAPVGRWLPNSALITAWNAARILPGGYDIDVVNVETRAIAENLPPTGIYRGAGRPEANCLIERLVDKAARALDMDPLDIRQRNLLRTEQMPHETPTGNLLDSGDYRAAIETLHRSGLWAQTLTDRNAIRADGGIAGVGVAFYVEPSGSGWESARVTMDADRRVTVQSGSSSQGHGRETAFAQIAADTLGVALETVHVTMGDTATCPQGIGALASRSTAIGGSAVLEACHEILSRLDSGDALPITTESRYENEGQAWGYGCYLVLLTIDQDTGRPTILRAHCVDDAGRIVNPAQVNGQIRGGFAQGLGEALMEQIAYDADGQILTGSFMDYAIPRAADMVPLTITKMETPSPLNTLGAKGVGEAGTIGAPAAILNAAMDALAPLGVTDLNMPLTANTLWSAIATATKDTQS